MKLKNIKKETSYERDSNGRLILSLEECEKGIEELIFRSLSLFDKKLKVGQRLVIAISKPELIQNKNFKILYQFKWYIHKSLTRNIIVMEKINT